MDTCWWSWTVTGLLFFWLLMHCHALPLLPGDIWSWMNTLALWWFGTNVLQRVLFTNRGLLRAVEISEPEISTHLDTSLWIFVGFCSHCDIDRSCSQKRRGPFAVGSNLDKHFQLDSWLCKIWINFTCRSAVDPGCQMHVASCCIR